jgi:hypothetical protein
MNSISALLNSESKVRQVSFRDPQEGGKADLAIAALFGASSAAGNGAGQHARRCRLYTVACEAGLLIELVVVRLRPTSEGETLSSNVIRLGMVVGSAVLLVGTIALAQDRGAAQPTAPSPVGVFNPIQGRMVIVTSRPDGSLVEKLLFRGLPEGGADTKAK